MVTVDESEVGGLNARRGVGEASHPGAVDQLPPLQNAAQQEPDDHQHHCDLDQGETALSPFHFDLLAAPRGSGAEPLPLHRKLPAARQRLPLRLCRRAARGDVLLPLTGGVTGRRRTSPGAHSGRSPHGSLSPSHVKANPLHRRRTIEESGRRAPARSAAGRRPPLRNSMDRSPSSGGEALRCDRCRTRNGAIGNDPFANSESSFMAPHRCTRRGANATR